MPKNARAEQSDQTLLKRDEDGDLLLQRRKTSRVADHWPQSTDLLLSEVHLHARLPENPSAATSLSSFHDASDGTLLASVRHAMGTPLENVGMQVSGCLLPCNPSSALDAALPACMELPRECFRLSGCHRLATAGVARQPDAC